MKKRILPLLCVAAICFVMLCTQFVYAAQPLDPDAEAALTLHYQKDGKTFPNLTIGIYRVAEAFPDGSFELIPPFSTFPISIHGITTQEQWQSITTTIQAYIIANQVAPDREEKTDADGIAGFQDLKTGLYFICEAMAEDTDGTYLFNAFLAYLPAPQPDGSYQYQVEANPKCTSFVPKTQYTVTKLWQDAGNQEARPKEIMVDIYKDGILQETQILHAGNNWSYTWYVSADDPGKWTVAERSVPDAYQVTIRENGGVFTVINTRQGKPVVPPQTGDSFALQPWIVAMCFSGIMLLLLELYHRRRR